MYRNNLQEEGVQYVVNLNKMKSEPYRDLVDQMFQQFNENLINNQDPHSQIENDETPGAKCQKKKSEQTKPLHFPVSYHKY